MFIDGNITVNDKKYAKRGRKLSKTIEAENRVNNLIESITKHLRANP
ncbi:MAG: hypothetical protein Q8942_03645 [Bacillota bacterium]|nr:hypothetical protein [Bacillota bacterium]